MAEIKLANADRVVIVDDFMVDYFLINAPRWNLTHQGYAVGFSRIRATNKRVLMHSLLYPPIKGMEVDHINRNKLDNRLENLRQVPCGTNGINQGKKKHADGSEFTSKFKCVSWDKSRSKWRACTTRGGKNVMLGRFNTEQEAADAIKEFITANEPENLVLFYA